ncbi:MAG: FUSC family protein [Cryomorphaceae bacterium]|nr:FUSC family protein [Flavobacteriales bacterium]
MNPKELEELSDEELLAAWKTAKSMKGYDAVIFGVLIGIAIYSVVKNGFGLLTFLPLIYLPVAGRNNKKFRELDNLLKGRELK